MISGLYHAIVQLADPSIRSVIWRSVLVSAAILALLVFAVQYALEGLAIFGIAWLDDAVRLLGGIGAFLVGLFMFPAFAGLVASFMFEAIAHAVERRHYPSLPPPRREPLREMLIVAVRFCGVAVALNGLLFLAVVPLLLVTVVLSPLVPALVYGLNGYLVGREYFELAAARRFDAQTAAVLRRKHRSRIFIAGMLLVVIMTLPVLNWLMPIVGAAYMVHIVEQMRSRYRNADGASADD